MKILCLVALTVLSCTVALAQDDSLKVKQITLNDGSEVVGRILSEDALRIQFKTNSGIEMTIERGLIKEIKDLEMEEHEGSLRRVDPNQTRLLFSPTARPLKQGNGYFSVYEIFFPMVSYGLTDFFSFSGGFSLIPFAETQLLYIAPKINIINREEFALSGGVLYMTLTEESAGIAYGVATYGKSSGAVTVGLGWGFVEGDFSGNPMLVLGGELQISRSTKLITENWLPPGDNEAIISFGIRFFGARLAGDFGLITSTEPTEGFPFFPWLGFAYNF
jgi:hypothetical protein